MQVNPICLAPISAVPGVQGFKSSFMQTSFYGIAIRYLLELHPRK